MDIVLSEEDQDQYYHDPGRHGFFWEFLNDLLHLVVFIYTLYGIIHFRVKFIKRVKLMRWISYLLIGHCWYLFIKFTVIAMVIYLSNRSSGSKNDLILNQLNCSLESHVHSLESSSLIEIELSTEGNGLVANFLNYIKDHYKHMDNRAFLLFSFLSIAVFFMLAIFPIELLWISIGFNYIRFVLNDPACMKELLLKTQNHLDRLDIRPEHKSISTNLLGIERSMNQRHLRSFYINRFKNYEKLGSRENTKMKSIYETRLVASIRNFNHSFSTNRMSQHNHDVNMTKKDMKKFKPFVRSESWFKISMIVYPIFALYYFILVLIIQSLIHVHARQTYAPKTCSSDTSVDQSLLNKTTFYETLYAMFALCCAASFYCPYFFGTTIELLFWLRELNQQLNLSEIVLKLDEKSPELLATTIESRCERQTVFLDSLNHKRDDLDGYINQFGGIRFIGSYLSHSADTQTRLFVRNVRMAIKLVPKRQNLLRATYVNLNIFFDELRETRFMMTCILRRTCEFVFGLAIMVAITKAQFESGFLKFSEVLGVCLIILNLYLACGALINSGVNKLSPQIHSIISASLAAGYDYNLLELWKRHLQSYGADEDEMCYRVYGYKITWKSILSLNGAITSAYMFTFR